MMMKISVLNHLSLKQNCSLCVYYERHRLFSRALTLSAFFLINYFEQAFLPFDSTVNNPAPFDYLLHGGEREKKLMFRCGCRRT